MSLVSDGREHRSMSRHIVVMQFESPTSNICSRGRFSVGVRNVCCLLHFFLFTRVMSSRWEVGLLLVTGLPGAVPGPGPENIAGASLACWRSGSVWGTCEAGQCQAGCQGGNAVGPGEAAFCQAGKAVGQGGAACCRAVSAVGQGGAACRPLGAGSSDGKSACCPASADVGQGDAACCQAAKAVSQGDTACCRAGEAASQGDAACCRAGKAVSQGDAACCRAGKAVSHGARWFRSADSRILLDTTSASTPIELTISAMHNHRALTPRPRGGR